MKQLASILLFLGAGCVYSQEYRDDAQLRAHFSVEGEINKHFSVHLDQQYRFNNNVSNFSRGSADIGIVWKINKAVRLLFDYVYIQRKTNSDIWRQRNWYYGALVLRQEVRHWRIIYRNMVQMRSGNVHSDNEHLYKIYDRNKLSLRYELNKRLTPYVSGEVYIPLNNPQYLGIERSRNQLGLLINTAKNQQLELYFMYQVWWVKGASWWNQDDRYPSHYFRRDFIYGIGYGIEF
jgi:hypothetical protein